MVSQTFNGPISDRLHEGLPAPDSATKYVSRFEQGRYGAVNVARRGLRHVLVWIPAATPIDGWTGDVLQYPAGTGRNSNLSDELKPANAAKALVVTYGLAANACELLAELLNEARSPADDHSSRHLVGCDSTSRPTADQF
jgi:hypothetical protein